MTPRDRLIRIAMYMAMKVPFAALPLLTNALVWFVLPNQAALPVFAVADLPYFAIMVSGELTLAGIMAPTNRGASIGNKAPFVPFLVSNLVALAAAFVLGSLYYGMAFPAANSLAYYPWAHLLDLSASCAGAALICALWASWSGRTDPEAIPSRVMFLFGRLTFAALPCVVNLAIAFLSVNRYQLFRVPDLCFFCIAVTGPAIVDLVQCRDTSQRVCAVSTVPLVILIIWSSISLGFWYYVTALPAGNNLDLPDTTGAIQMSAFLCAAIALIATIVVEFLVSRAPRA